MISQDDRLLELLGGLCNGNLPLEEERQLANLLRDEPDARRMYVRYMDVHLALADLDLAGGEVSDSLLADALADEETAGGDFAVFPYSGDLLPLTESDMPDGRRLGPISYFSQVGPLSYMVATVVMCAMLLTAWAYKITHNDNLLTVNSTPTGIEKPPVEFVGHITGMKDCRWVDEGAGTIVGASVPLGREYALTAGLLEITYNTGARVILEGLCNYRVDSDAGGYLAVGRLTARIQKRGESEERRGLAASAAGAKPRVANPNSQINKSPVPLFAIHTPTAVVTDLGTEFGVEVRENGDTVSHVFQGVVEVQITGNSTKSIILKANQSALVNKVENGARLTLKREADAPPKFVRRLREPPKYLDLLDIVAGGNGTGSRRERGIDPAIGKQDTWFIDNERQDDHGYHRVTWHKLIDGVFIPYLPTCLPPAPLDVQIDSTGNTFDRFLEGKVVEGKHHYASTIQGYTRGSIWSRAADTQSAGAKNGDGWIYSLIDDTKHMPKGRGLLGLHANVGITFDLAAMRKMYDGIRPSRLRATISMGDGPRKYPDAFGVADLWIIVDGRLEWVRKNIRHKDGTIDVDLSLGARDRFLTIVSSNGSFGKAYDWIVVGDPVLEMKPTQSEEH